MFLEENNKEEFLNENNQVSVEKDSFIKKEEKIKKSEINKDLKELEKINEASKVISKEESKLVATATEVVPTKEIELAKTAHKKTQPSDPKKRINSNRNHQRRPKFVTEFEERVIDIARVTKTVKGGRRFSFSALVVIGNKKGKVSWGHGKANEVPDAIKKAIKDAKTRLINVPIIEKRTIPHEIQTKFLASTVLLKPAPKGKGIIASGAIRAVIELAGYKDIYTKSLGRSRSKTNSVKATYKALGELRTAKEIAKLRGVNIERLLG